MDARYIPLSFVLSREGRGDLGVLLNSSERNHENTGVDSKCLFRLHRDRTTGSWINDG